MISHNKYLVKIAEQKKRNKELEAAEVAGKALVADKVGDAAGMGLGGIIAAKLGRNKALGALIGATTVGSGLAYASIRKDYLNKKAGVFPTGNLMGMLKKPPIQSPTSTTSPLNTVTTGVRG